MKQYNHLAQAAQPLQLGLVAAPAAAGTAGGRQTTVLPLEISRPLFAHRLPQPSLILNFIYPNKLVEL